MAEELNVNVTGINLPPIKVEGTLNIPTINLTGQTGKSAYEIWLEAGNSGTREDFLNSLKGQNGDDGLDGNDGLPGKDASAEESYKELLGLNVWCENATVDEVLKGLIRGLGNVIKKPFKQLDFDRPQKGQTYVNVYGTPHFKVALLGKGAAAGVSIGDDGRARLDLDNPFMADDIQLEYFNMLGSIVGTYRVSGYGDIKTEIKQWEFRNSFDKTDFEFPEVTTVGEKCFPSTAVSIKLPKATRIARNAFYECNSRLMLISAPSFVMTDEEYWDPFSMSSTGEIVLNELSSISALTQLSSVVYEGTIYNQDKSKKFDADTKTWVPVQ